MHQPTTFEICAGAGGQALGLDQAGFAHAALVELEPVACQTLRVNRPEWPVVEADLQSYSATPYLGVDMLSGGVPCPPFSVAGQQLGAADERDLFPTALRLVEECKPQVIMLENVKGLLSPLFSDYRRNIELRLKSLGYVAGWRLLNASSFGVSQLRPRVVMVAVRAERSEHFRWPQEHTTKPVSVGDLLYDLMSARGWLGSVAWRERASTIAPTLVGGSRKHGGPDLGPTRARKAWAALGVDGSGLADLAPPPDFEGMPKLTPRMTARIQGFPDNWEFHGKKTAAYRQIGNAFPPPVAQAVARQIMKVLEHQTAHTLR